MENNQTDLEEVIQEVQQEKTVEETVEKDLSKFESKDDDSVIKVDLSKPPGYWKTTTRKYPKANRLYG